MKRAEQIPVFLLTGFLGAGKTTLLNQLLQDPALHDTALIINEFGLVPVDHDLVREGSERPMVTTTGCICCTAGSDLRSSLDQLLAGRKDGSLPPFSRVIVETTGLADPAPIINSLIPGGLQATSLRDHAVARAFRLSSVITVVNGEGVQAALDAHPESLRQIAFADHVVVNRADADLAPQLRAINPTVRIHRKIARDLLTPGSYTAFGKGENVQDWLENDSHIGHAGHFHDLNRHGNVVAVPLTRDDPIDNMAFRDFIAGIAARPGILRIKGLVALRDDPSVPAMVHAVQHRLYPITLLDSWPDGQARTRLVIIGAGLDDAAIRAEFAALSAKSQPFLKVLARVARTGGL
ncbi:GTP-binding protein [Paracoccus sp. Z330]|uniref:GTP-binding protein n=1 Tax=Paracoccus onchidii TaxID=3017813 RepID=A0ABT4ZE93_9RHOB|nr:GTP-binding protein [Paracoccus onchidii]MDB6177671.1 GTP-binding protein [Paracoccus onchidii]